MNITRATSDDSVLAELGQRLARTRLELNLTQAELAEQAGLARATITRLEAGEQVKLSAFVRVLRELDLLDALDRLVPEPLPSPIERLKLEGRRRQRASGSRRRGPATEESA